jgi:hypothetical protein
MLEALRSGQGHPTPEQAIDALRQGLCMYALRSKCSGPPMSVGLRDSDDANAILCCKAHYGRLRKLNSRSLSNLERVLLVAFARSEP